MSPNFVSTLIVIAVLALAGAAFLGAAGAVL